MLFNKKIRGSIWALILLSLGGWLLHNKIHPLSADGNPAFYLPFILGILNFIVVPICFNFKRTTVLAYLINGFSVILGTITMLHINLVALPTTLTVKYIFLNSNLPYICLLLPKLFIAQTILQFHYPTGTGRLFTSFWWFKHFIYVSIVYILGQILWS